MCQLVKTTVGPMWAFKQYSLTVSFHPPLKIRCKQNYASPLIYLMSASAKISCAGIGVEVVCNRRYIEGAATLLAGIQSAYYQQLYFHCIPLSLIYGLSQHPCLF
jgi:hypothetical protein